MPGSTVDGLEGLSIGHLAAAIGMSKSGLYAHFGSKQELQLATVAEAERILDDEVAQPALAARPGLAQLARVRSRARAPAHCGRPGRPGRHGPRLDPRSPPVRRAAARHRHPRRPGIGPR
jgi:AcrR family transcriptional regulator